MNLTDTFASTAALTIPVLMLAGALELRNLADTVNRQVTKIIKQGIDELRPEYLISAVSSDDIDTDLRFVLRLIKVASRGVAIFIPVAWSIVLLFSGVTEILCFLYLAGAYTSSSLVLLAIIAIAMMILLLVIAPMVQTVYTAPSTPYHGFRTKKILTKIRDEIPIGPEFLQLSAEEQEKNVKRIKSILADDSSDDPTRK
jgi:hypothetical protein